MVISSETIDALIRAHVAPRQQNGFGRIIITEKASWLQTSGERIPIELPPNSNLSNGTTVRYEISGNIISITQAGALKDAASPSAADAFKPPRNTASTEGAGPLRSSPISVTAGLPPGLYLFTSAEDAATFAGKSGDDDLLRQLRSFIAENGAVALRIETTTTNESRLILLRLPEIVAALQTFQASLTSAGLSSIPVDVFKQVLFDLGALPFAPLIDLDVSLAAGTAPMPISRAGSAEAQNHALAQWLHATLTSNKHPPIIAPLIPATPASSMMSELIPMLPSITGTAGGTPPVPEDFGLTQQSFGKSSIAGDPVTSAAQRIGFTFEHSLGAPPQTTDSALPEKTLKALLLRLSAQLSTTDAASAETVPKPMPDGRGFPPAHAQPIAQSNHSAPAGRPSDEQRNLLLTALRLLPRAEELPPGKPYAIPGQPVALSPSRLEMAATHPAEPVAATLLKTITEKITDAIALLKEPSPQQTASGARPIELPAERKTATILMRFTEIANLLERAASLKTALPLTAQSTPLIRQALDSIETLIRLLEPAPEKDPSAGPAPGSNRARTEIGQPPERTTQPASNLLQQTMLSKAVDTALDHLESLQLLARQTPTAQGTQQIIALPIKFDDQWTEINVRFLHHRQRKSSKNSKKFSVDIDVAPARLGAIHAHLDYRAPAQLQFSAEFERSETRNWFLNHKEEFREALSRNGSALISMELRQLRQKTATSTTAPCDGSGAIDLTG